MYTVAPAKVVVLRPPPPPPPEEEEAGAAAGVGCDGVICGREAGAVGERRREELWGNFISGTLAVSFPA
jgi:hypothetical protein